jgi:hypothetical protein
MNYSAAYHGVSMNDTFCSNAATYWGLTPAVFAIYTAYSF